MTRIPALAVLSAALLLGGCTSGYNQFYRSADGATPEAIARLRVAPAPKDPVVDHVNVVDEDLWAQYYRNGYVAIGESAFNSGRAEPESNAIAQARRVGADRVLIINPRYTGSQTSVVPLTVPKTTTSYTTANATAYGPGGTVNAYGNATTTTYGTRTTYIPITVHRSDYGAVYFVKRKFLFGAGFDDLTADQRQELQSNHGVALRDIVNDTPAFRADFLPGDIVVGFGVSPVYNSAEFGKLLESAAGQTVDVTVIRKGQRLVKKVSISTY